MVKQVPRRRAAWRPPGWRRSPKAYMLSVAGAALIALGVAVLDTLWLVLAGLGLTLAGWLFVRRS
ncbi:hypothetical protein [Phytohabitans suffuscus]|uniref:Uncharacterized protein n=1 Tax=Phytohabitans suffuscus TaxID=624315 RepID=A0A6F8YA84_9ACTN|nr:hypothetical protein [Phytohabitans suffuscus]BCB82977.1 hypothetical protein Psuf_002900 [Phytohabitans suffuscus]